MQSATLIVQWSFAVTLLFAMAFSNLAAQDEGKSKKQSYWSNSQKYDLGFRIGPNVTFQSVTDRERKDDFGSLPHPGYHFAGFVSFPLPANFSFFSEAGYMRGGRKMKIQDVQWQTDFTYHFLTGSMGLRKALNVNFAEGIEGEFFVNVGPNISYLMGGKGRISVPDGGPGTEFKIEFNNYDSADWGDFYRYFINKPNRVLFGLDLGIGAEAPITSKQKIFAEFRFTWGHTNLGTLQTENRLNILNFDDTMMVNLKTISFDLLYTFGFDRRQSKQGKSTLRAPSRRR